MDVLVYENVLGIDKVYVKLISRPEGDPIDLMFALAKKSVKIDQPLFIPEFLNKFTREQKIKFLIDVVFKRGHKGILEHLNYTFEIWGVSRSMTHQAVRNRIASFLEGSLRYVNVVKGTYRYIVPMALRGNSPELIAARAEYHEDVKQMIGMTKKWYDKGIALGLPEFRATELARTTIPHNACTTYGFTMNVAALVMLAQKRECERAEDEFRSVASPIITALKAEIPGFLDHIGPTCQMYGYCPEGKSCCGKAPTLDMLLESYHHN